MFQFVYINFYKYLICTGNSKRSIFRIVTGCLFPSSSSGPPRTSDGNEIIAGHTFKGKDNSQDKQFDKGDYKTSKL